MSLTVQYSTGVVSSSSASPKSPQNPEEHLVAAQWTLFVLQYFVFPVVAYLACAVNYFLIFTVCDLGMRRASMVHMAGIAVADFVQTFGLIG